MYLHAVGTAERRAFSPSIGNSTRAGGQRIGSRTAVLVTLESQDRPPFRPYGGGPGYPHFPISHVVGGKCGEVREKCN